MTIGIYYSTSIRWGSYLSEIPDEVQDKNVSHSKYISKENGSTVILYTCVIQLFFCVRREIKLRQL